MCASGQATTYTMTPPSTVTLGVVKELSGEWNGGLLSSVMKVDSVCMDINI